MTAGPALCAQRSRCSEPGTPWTPRAASPPAPSRTSRACWPTCATTCGAAASVWRSRVPRSCTRTSSCARLLSTSQSCASAPRWRPSWCWHRRGGSCSLRSAWRRHWRPWRIAWTPPAPMAWPGPTSCATRAWPRRRCGALRRALPSPTPLFCNAPGRSSDLGCVIVFHVRSVGTNGDSLVSMIDFDRLQRLEDEAVSAGYMLSRSGVSDVTRLASKCLLRIMDMACSTQQWTSFMATSDVGIARIVDGLPTAAVWAAALSVGAVFDMYNVWHMHLSSAIKLKAHLEELQPAEWQRTCRVVLDQVAKLAAITVRVGGALLVRLGMSEACSAGLHAIRRIGAGAAADLAGEQAWGAARAAGHLASELAAARRGREKVLATVSAIVNSWAEGEREAMEGEAREPVLQRVGGVAAAADSTPQPHD